MGDGFVIQNGVLEQYSLREEELVVPQGVHTIGEGAFKSAVSLRRVSLPDSLRVIGDNAFKGCRRLEEINFPSQLEQLGSYAFHRCHALREAIFPVSLKELGSCAFLYCDSLSRVSMPGVRRVGQQAFLNDTSLVRLELSQDLEVGDLRDVFTGCYNVGEISLSGGVSHRGNLLDLILEDLPAHPVIQKVAVDIFRMMDLEGRTVTKFRTNLRHVEIPQGVEAIGKSCFFEKKGILSVSLPASLRRVESRAFRNCINLEEVRFATQDVSIQRDAFKNCTTLRRISLPEGNWELAGLPHGQEETRPPLVRTIHTQLLGNFLLAGNVLLKYRGEEERVVVPDGVTVIAQEAFAGNQVVGKVVLPETVEEIHREAFAGCSLLQTIALPERLRVLGEGAFRDCVKLLRIRLPETLETLEPNLFNRCAKLGEVQLGEGLRAICSMAFYRCGALREVAFPPSLREIGVMAFYQCQSLREIVLPQGLERLGSNAFTASGLRRVEMSCNLLAHGTGVFSSCKKLKSIRFGGAVTQIGEKLAYACPSLEEVELPANLENIGPQAFEESPFWQKLSSNILGKIFVRGETLSGEVEIPEGIEAIAGGAFYGNQELTALQLPSSLRRIGSRAFCGCTALRSISLPADVQRLEEGTFAYCAALECVEGEIADIGDNAFFGCESLQMAPITNAQTIGRSAFQGCHRLEQPSSGTPVIGERAFWDTALLRRLQRESPLIILGNTVVDASRCAGEVVVPLGVRHISPYAFAGNTRVTSVLLPHGLEEIGEGAFYGCKGLVQVALPPTLQRVGREAFSRCIALSAVQCAAVEVEEGAFSYCTGLRSAALKQVKSLPARAFQGCEKLENLQLGNAESIGAESFGGCDALTTFDFAGISFIGRESFRSCNSLMRVDLGGAKVASRAFQDCGRLEEVALSGKEEHLGSHILFGCTSLKTIVLDGHPHILESYHDLFRPDLPQLVRTLYAGAVSCLDIDEDGRVQSFSGEGQILRIPQGVTGIAGEAFLARPMLEEIFIPPSVAELGPRVFHGTRWLDRQREQSALVVVNDILVDAAGCSGQVEIPPVRQVAGWAFAGNLALTGIKFTSTRTGVREYAFRNCINLKSVTLPHGAVYRFTGIADRSREEWPPLVRQIVHECYNCFKTDEQGVLVESTGNIANLVLAEGITAVGDKVFQEGNLLERITLANSTKALGEYAFAGCRWLVEVLGAQGVCHIGKGAFSGCVLLEEVHLSHHLQSIGPRAFEHCTSLRHVVIPEGITALPEKAFFRCKSLRSVRLPSTLRSIGKEAFAFCSALEEINFPKGLQQVDSRAFAWCDKLRVRMDRENLLLAEDCFQGVGT